MSAQRVADEADTLLKVPRRAFVGRSPLFDVVRSCHVVHPILASERSASSP